MGPKRGPHGVPVKAKSVKHRLRDWVHVFRRLLVLAAALCYIYASLEAAYRSMLVLRGEVDKSMTFVPYVSTLVPSYVGTSTIRSSPLVVQTLRNATALRSDAVYLQSETEVSFEGCGSDFKTFNTWTYNNTYMRQNLEDLIADTSYNLTFLKESELILPVVDCSSGAIVFADDSATRVFYLMRNKKDPDDLSILTWSLSTQDYRLSEEHQVGATASITLTFIKDVRDSSVTYYHVMRLGFPFLQNQYQPYTLLRLTSESFWELESIPRDGTKEASRIVQTACRTGFFINAETEQCNVKNLNWDLVQDPIEAMKVWPWSGFTTVRDSWAWVHGIHFLFAFSSLFNLLVLMTVVYQNTREGKIWIGDAFVSVSSTLTIRALLVLLTWYVNGFWTLMEFCLKESNELADVQNIFTYPSIIHADLLTLYLGMAGLLGHLLVERIDPALAVFLFEIGFYNRRAIATWFPKTMEVSSTFANFDYLLGLSFMETKHTSLTPMRLWTMHELPDKYVTFILATLFPVFVSFALIVLYVPVRKVYRYYYPDFKVTISRATGVSTETDALLTWKGSLTIFEVATGAPLQNRVGLVTDYNSCIYIKGMKFASADGVYCNGYVVASGKWLISTDDLFVVIVMIVTRVRFKNVYVYEVSGHAVQQTARLLYPETMTLMELAHLNVTMLS